MPNKTKNVTVNGKISRGRTYKRQDITGRRFGKLTVLGYSHDDPNGDCISIWKCQCDCSRISYVRLGALNAGKIRSCACVNFGVDERVRHPLHPIWTSIKQRCYNKKCPGYKNYGGRGIKLYKPWSDSYIAFYTDVLALYKRGFQIDRINNDGNYEPGNIRWVDSKTNMRNSRNTILTKEQVIEIRRSNLPHGELAKIYPVKRQTISIIKSRKSKVWEDAW